MTPWSTSWGHYIAIYILTLLTYLLYIAIIEKFRSYIAIYAV